MPNGKGTSDWGWIPGAEELFIFLVISFFSTIFFQILGLTGMKFILLGCLIGLIASFLLLWANNGYPGLKK